MEKVRSLLISWTTFAIEHPYRLGAVILPND